MRTGAIYIDDPEKGLYIAGRLSTNGFSGTISVELPNDEGTLSGAYDNEGPVINIGGQTINVEDYLD